MANDIEDFEPTPKRDTPRWVRAVTVSGLALGLLTLLLFALNGFLGNPLGVPVTETTPAPAAVLATPVYTDRALDLYVLDVGQGDCIFVRTADGATLLVDAGEAGSFPVLQTLLDSLRVERLDVVVATHLHADHIGAMPDVLDAYPVGSFYWSDYPVDSPTAEALASSLAAHGITPVPVTATMTSTRMLDKNTELRFLSPFDAVYDSANESSVALRIGYGATAAVLTGDTGALAERLMVKALPNALLRANVLKLGHHGSYSSTTQKFLNAVHPDIAVASCGRDNPFGHPHEEIRALLASENIPLLTTAEYGTLHVVLDGANVRVVE